MCVGGWGRGVVDGWYIAARAPTINIAVDLYEEDWCH